MSEIDFTNLVSRALLEQDENQSTTADLQGDKLAVILKGLNSKFALLPITSEDLAKIYTFFQSRYFTGEQVLTSSLFDILPVVDVVARSHSGSDKAKSIAKTKDINVFYEPLYKNINSLISKLKPLQNGYVFEDGEMNRLYKIALKEKNNNILAENVWPSISNLTITNSLLKIFDTRLTGIEKTKITINMLTSVFSPNIQSRASFLRYCDTLIKDVYTNLSQYSSGAKKANKDIVEVLQNINVGYDDLLQLATYTHKFYEELLKTEFSNAQEVNNTPNYQLRAVNASMEHIVENAYLLAQTGAFKFTLPAIKEVSGRSIPVPPQSSQTEKEVKRDKPVYNLQQIEKMNSVSGNEIIKILKSMSTGVRTKESIWKTVSNVAGALGALRVGMGPVG